MLQEQKRFIYPEPILKHVENAHGLLALYSQCTLAHLCCAVDSGRAVPCRPIAAWTFRGMNMPAVTPFVCCSEISDCRRKYNETRWLTHVFRLHRAA